MHNTVLAKRRAVAIDRIVNRATALVQHLELDPALAEALQPKTIKDPQAAEMIRLEALATLIDQMAINAGVPDQEQPDATIHEFNVRLVPAQAPGTEDLPEPVLEEEVIPIEGESEIEDFPADELPSKKSSRKKSK
jgi:hypothetical protein